MDFDVGNLFQKTVNLVCKNAPRILVGSIFSIIVAICVHGIMTNDDGYPLKSVFVLGMASAFGIFHIYENYKKKHIETEKVSEQNNSSVAQEKKTRLSCVHFGLNAFPKIEYLRRELKRLHDTLPDFTDFLREYEYKLLTTEQSPTQLSSEDKTGNGKIKLNKFNIQQLLVLNDMKQVDFNEVHIYLFGNCPVERVVKAISPHILPKEVVSKGKVTFHTIEVTSEIHGRIYSTKTKKVNPPTAYICYIECMLDQDLEKKVEECLLMLQLPDEILLQVKFITNWNPESIRHALVKAKPPLQNSLQESDILCIESQYLRLKLSNALSFGIFKYLQDIESSLRICLEMLKESEKFPLYGYNPGCISDHSRESAQTSASQNESEFLQRVFQQLVSETEQKSRKEKHEIEISLQNGIANVESLLLEMPTELIKILKLSRHLDIPQKFKDNLKRLKNEGVVAFGIWSDHVKVFVTKDDKQESIRTDLKGKIDNIALDGSIDVKIVQVMKPFIKHHVRQGNKVIKEEDHNYGTLGIFAATDQERVVALTASHVIQKNQTAETEVGGERIKLGKCIASNPTSQIRKDLAVIQVDPSTIEKCQVYLVDEADRKCNSILFEGQFQDIKRKRVFKRGATTDWTCGQVQSEIEHTDGEKLIAIKGLDGAFSKEGDSGSVVYMYENNDAENVNIKLLSMIVGNINAYEGELKDHTCAFPLKSGFDSVRDTEQINLNLY